MAARPLLLLAALRAAAAAWTTVGSACGMRPLHLRGGRTLGPLRLGDEHDGASSAFFQGCRNFGFDDGDSEWRPFTFVLDMPKYLARARLAAPAAAQQLEERLPAEAQRRLGSAGAVVCGPARICLDEFLQSRGQRLRDMAWWLQRPNLTTGGAGAFLCDKLLSAYFDIYFDLLRTLVELPRPLPSECEARFATAGEAWVDDRRVMAAATPGASVRDAEGQGLSRVAVCLHGGVRSFTHSEVYESLRDNVLRSLEASFLRIFYVMNLTSDNCSWSAAPSARQFSLVEVAPAMDALGKGGLTASVTLEPACCWPELIEGLSYADCFTDQVSGPVLFRGSEQCELDIAQYEGVHGVAFDWVLLARLDLRWAFPIGNIRFFAPGHVHAPKLALYEMGDTFALVPRGLLPIYVGAFRRGPLGSSSSRYFCLTKAQISLVRKGKLCDLPGYDRCLHCWFGSPGCLLELHLRRHGVPIRHIPEEIAMRTPRWMHTQVGGQR